MKVPPLNLNPDVNRVGMALPFGPDLLWRYPLSSLQHSALAPPSSPLLDVKNQMPAQLAVDPRLWSREDVSTFLRWFEREFELPKIDSTKFCMNGKALCMLTKNDLADRAPGAGDVLHNTLQFLLRDAPQVPPSPLTPHHPLLSPSPLTTPTSQPWSLVGSDFHTLGHLLQQGGSVTLSPAPSEQSGGSPRHPDPSAPQGTYNHSSSASTGSTHSGSHSDSEDSTRDSSPQRSPLPSQSMQSSFSAQALASLKHLTDYQRAAAAAAAAAVAAHNYESIPQHQQQQQFMQSSHYQSQQQSQQQQQQQQQQQPQQQQQHTSPPFNSDEPVETVTNGRLLWDFLQQLLNDSQQRYQQYIAWKNRETGVFKIVDPPGLARLWGIQKNHLSMNYDKMSRALRYYYRVNILRKVQGERHCYQFLRNPSELKSIKNISLLRGAPVPLPKKWELPPPPSTPMEDESLAGLSSVSLPRKWEIPPPSSTPMEDEGPTDLSMPQQQQSRVEMLSSSSHHSQHQPFEQRSADVTITSSRQQQQKFDHRSEMETQPENLTIDRSDIKTESFNSDNFE